MAHVNCQYVLLGTVVIVFLETAMFASVFAGALQHHIAKEFKGLDHYEAQLSKLKQAVSNGRTNATRQRTKQQSEKQVAISEKLGHVPYVETLTDRTMAQRATNTTDEYPFIKGKQHPARNSYRIRPLHKRTLRDQHRRINRTVKKALTCEDVNIHTEQRVWPCFTLRHFLDRDKLLKILKVGNTKEACEKRPGVKCCYTCKMLGHNNSAPATERPASTTLRPETKATAERPETKATAERPDSRTCEDVNIYTKQRVWPCVTLRHFLDRDKLLKSLNVGNTKEACEKRPGVKCCYTCKLLGHNNSAPATERPASTTERPETKATAERPETKATAERPETKATAERPDDIVATELTTESGIVICFFAALAILAFYLCCHCVRVNAKRHTLMEAYKESLKQGETPGDLPPTFMTLSTRMCCFRSGEPGKSVDAVSRKKSVTNKSGTSKSGTEISGTNEKTSEKKRKKKKKKSKKKKKKKSKTSDENVNQTSNSLRRIHFHGDSSRYNTDDDNVNAYTHKCYYNNNITRRMQKFYAHPDHKSQPFVENYREMANLDIYPDEPRRSLKSHSDYRILHNGQFPYNRKTRQECTCEPMTKAQVDLDRYQKQRHQLTCDSYDPVAVMSLFLSDDTGSETGSDSERDTSSGKETIYSRRG